MAYTYAEFQGYLTAIGQERADALAIQASLAGVEITKRAFDSTGTSTGPSSPSSRFSATPGPGESLEF